MFSLHGMEIYSRFGFVFSQFYCPAFILWQKVEVLLCACQLGHKGSRSAAWTLCKNLPLAGKVWELKTQRELRNGGKQSQPINYSRHSLFASVWNALKCWREDDRYTCCWWALTGPGLGVNHQSDGKGSRHKSTDMAQWIYVQWVKTSVRTECLNPIGRSPWMGHKKSPRRPRLPLWCWQWRGRSLGSSRWSLEPVRPWTPDQSAAGH